jgi:hypothetical protein
MKIISLDKFRGRNPRGYFRDLPDEVRHRAYQWLHRFVKRWGRNLPPWRFAILVGQAKRLALNPPSSKWGRSMLAKRGGLAVQHRYWLEGRNPTGIATKVRLATRRSKSRGQSEQSERLRIKYLDLNL